MMEIRFCLIRSYFLCKIFANSKIFRNFAPSERKRLLIGKQCDGRL